MIAFFIGKKNKKIENISQEKGFDKIIFIKEVSSVEEINKKEKDNYDAVLIKTTNTENFRRLVDKASNYFEPYVLGINDKINRAALEHKKVKALVSPEFARKYDYKDYRNSGLNQVLCKIAYKNNKKIIENFSEFLEKDKKEKALLLGRILQNSRLCKKYKVEFIITIFAKDEEGLICATEIEDFKKILV